MVFHAGRPAVQLGDKRKSNLLMAATASNRKDQSQEESMGFVLTLVYIGLTVLSPADLFPELAEYRIMVWLGTAAFVSSVGGIVSRYSLSLRQVYLMLGFMVTICLSRALNGWFGGIPAALAYFVPVAMVFFLIVWNISTPARLRLLAVELILIAIYFVVRGAVAYYKETEDSPFAMVQPVLINTTTGETHNYLRIRALGVLNDPNDFAQYLAMLLPFILPAWRRNRIFRNVLLCLVPATVLIYGIYLTNSRGGIVALALLAVFLITDRLGKKRSALFAPLAVILILALNQSGRAISLQEGSARARADAWSEGLGMFQRSPLWGIGFGTYGESYELTAHNSLVLCLAELGLIGCSVWLGLIVCSVIQLKAFAARWRSNTTKDTAQWALALRLSLYSSLAASWFLSRTYTSTLYLALGIASALPNVFSNGDNVVEQPRKWIRVTMAVLPVTVIAVYLTVRLRAV